MTIATNLKVKEGILTAEKNLKTMREEIDKARKGGITVTKQIEDYNILQKKVSLLKEAYT